MQTILDTLVREKSVTGPDAGQAARIALVTLWFVADYAVTWILS